jgi:hypothetical protein
MEIGGKKKLENGWGLVELCYLVFVYLLFWVLLYIFII